MKKEKELIEEYIKQGHNKKYLKEKFKLIGKDPQIIDNYFRSEKIRKIKILVILLIGFVCIFSIFMKLHFQTSQ